MGMFLVYTEKCWTISKRGYTTDR